MADERISITPLTNPGDPEVKELLVQLALDEEAAYDHPQHSRDAIADSTGPIKRRFTGENHVFVARDETGKSLGVIWCVLFDPGTGLEGEIAELYVSPEARGRGIGTMLCFEARDLFLKRRVTFACVWTRENNPAALKAYRAAGFATTEQAVLTWLPLP